MLIVFANSYFFYLYIFFLHFTCASSLSLRERWQIKCNWIIMSFMACYIRLLNLWLFLKGTASWILIKILIMVCLIIRQLLLSVFSACIGILLCRPEEGIINTCTEVKIQIWSDLVNELFCAIWKLVCFPLYVGHNHCHENLGNHLFSWPP